MSTTQIEKVHAREIFDSRGRPTVEAEVRLRGGAIAFASAPAGASRGAAEAHELRDGGARHEGRGVTQAVKGAVTEIDWALHGVDAFDQAGVDMTLEALDGTPQLSRLGGNATVAVSMAVLRAASVATGVKLYAHIAAQMGTRQPVLPMPMVNILSGGLHAGRGMDVQDFLMIPAGATSYAQALDWVLSVRTAAAEMAAERRITTLLADEGGLSPGFEDSVTALDFMVEAFERAGLRPGEDAAIALDIASSSLVDNKGAYLFARAGKTFRSPEMIDMLAAWTKSYPIVSIEDGLHEEDWEHWPTLTKRLGAIQLVGDDFFCTSADRIARGQAEGSANSVLIKINQAGTFNRAVSAIGQARSKSYSTVISARSGETEDSFLADFAVGSAGGQIKIGSVRNSERLAKYNQLLRIAEDDLPFAGRATLAGA